MSEECKRLSQLLMNGRQIKMRSKLLPSLPFKRGRTLILSTSAVGQAMGVAGAADV